jgi:hypothetical protein
VRSLGRWQRQVIAHLRETDQGAPPKKNTLDDLIAVGGEAETKRERESRLRSIFSLHDKGLIEEYRSEIEPEPVQMQFRLTGEGWVHA